MSYYFLEPPIPLVSTAEPPPFPLEALPAVLQNYVKQISNALQVHPDMPSALSLAILAACVQGKTKINITPEWAGGTKPLLRCHCRTGRKKVRCILSSYRTDLSLYGKLQPYPRRRNCRISE